jgi:hypothetical protein
MSIYDPIAEALNLTPTHIDFNDLIEGVDYFPWKQPSAWNKGIPCTKEQKLANSLKMKGRKRSISDCEAISRGKTGKKRKPFSEETKRKISEAAKRQWLENPIVRNPMSDETKKTISNTKKAINRTNNEES